MTDTLMHDSSGSPEPARRQEQPGRPRRLAVPIVLQLLAMIGLGAVLYPAAADWFAQLRHNAEISGYTDSAERLSNTDSAALLDAARAYNAHLTPGVLRDPYSDDAAAEQLDTAYRAYEDLLRVNERGVMGELSYPRLGIGLPIYHGTGEDSLSRGVGHLYGSSLPVGGESTHSVLTSHSGLPQAKLLSGLLDAKVGDTFQVSVLGETRFYEVESVETVEPEATESLRTITGEDRLTLFTCTPIGINSHRFLVHGVRTDAPAEAGTQTIAGDGRTAGFPWWALGFIGGSGVVAYLLFAPPHRRATGSSAGSPITGTTSNSFAQTEESA